MRDGKGDRETGADDRRIDEVRKLIIIRGVGKGCDDLDVAGLSSNTGAGAVLGNWNGVVYRQNELFLAKDDFDLKWRCLPKSDGDLVVSEQIFAFLCLNWNVACDGHDISQGAVDIGGEANLIGLVLAERRIC